MADERARHSNPWADDNVGQPAGSRRTPAALMNTAEVAELLAVSERTVKRLLKRGFPCIRVGRSVRFDPQAVARWVDARREGA